MSDITKNTIPKIVGSNDDLDFKYLREKGIEYIEHLSESLWTDYNTHDPGVTILEMLCYAITDLGNRINLPLKYLLAPEEKEKKLEDQFFRETQILISKPVNENDYRRLFIDIEDVKNCWLKPYKKKVFVDCKNDRLSYKSTDFDAVHSDFKSDFDLNGLYSVIVDFDKLDEEKYPDETAKNARYEEIKNEIISLYHQNRNLCEDIIEVEKVKTHPIAVCASIEVEPEVDEELVKAKIIRAIENYFSPNIRFYSLKQMLNKGYTSDQIFEGPLLNNGFIDPEELEKADLRKEVRLSDLIQLIMDIEGVKVIKDITINDCLDPDNEKDEWIICVEDGFKPQMCIQSEFSFFKGVLPLNINNKVVDSYIKQLEEAEEAQQELAGIDMELDIPEGQFLNTNETTTIQNDFPDTYGISEFGLPSRLSVARKAKAKQLKAYLLFFDQIFASYFAHLGKVKDLLSVDNQLKRTYFTQAVTDIKDFDEIVNGYLSKTDDEKAEAFFQDLDKKIERKNKLLDHLIARFAERFSEYSFLMKELYGSASERLVVKSKEDFLADYGEIVDDDGTILNKGISNWRGAAFNYFKRTPAELWDSDNVSGAQKRIARLSGMKNFDRRNLSATFVNLSEHTGSDGKKFYRWKIKNNDGQFVLASVKKYKNPQSAEDHLYLAAVKTIETVDEDIVEAFKEEIVDGTVIGNIEIKITSGNKFSFNIVEVDADTSALVETIAKHNKKYNTKEELETAILSAIAFMTNDYTEEGMFVVEHMLLRPDVTTDTVPLNIFIPICTNNCESCEPVDPYSFRVTVVLPGWTYRFSNPDFRNFLEELIRKELPAHILARICWIGYRKDKVPEDENQMEEFESAYKDFLLSKTNSGQTQNTNKLKRLNKILAELYSIYPTGRLIDCDDEEDSLEGKIILSRTNIGNL